MILIIINNILLLHIKYTIKYFVVQVLLIIISLNTNNRTTQILSKIHQKNYTFF